MPTATLAEPMTLGALIRSVLESTDLLTPDAVADEVVRLTPEGSLREFYRQALRERVRATMQVVAAHSMCVSTEESEQTSPSGQRSTDAHVGLAGRGAKQKPVKSAKFAMINAAHLKRLRERLYVDGEWKMFGSLTRPELLALADARESTAAANAAMAAKYRRVDKEMENLGVEKVEDLPADVLDAALRG